MFDPWTADIDAVVAAQIAAQRAAEGAEPAFDLVGFCTWARCPLQQWRAAQCLLEDRSQIEGAKDRGMVLWSVESCLRYGLVAPDWLVEDFSSRLHTVSMVQATSWDDDRAFGRPFPKGAHRDSLVRRAELGGRVHQMVSMARSEDGRAVDKGLFEDVGAEFGIGATLAEEIYRSRLERLRERGLSDAEKAYDAARARLRLAGAWPWWWD